MILITPIL